MFSFLAEKKVAVIHFLIAVALVPALVYIGTTLLNAAIGSFFLGVMYKLYQVLNGIKTIKEAGFYLIPVALGAGVGVLVALFV